MALRGSELWARRPRLLTFSKAFAWHLGRFLTWVPVAIFFNDNVADITLINGHSMSPFLNSRPDETTARDVCLNLKYSSQHNLKRGMIVTFQ